MNYNYGNNKKKNPLPKAIDACFFTQDSFIFFSHCWEKKKKKKHHYDYFIFLNLFEDIVQSILFKQEWFTVNTQPVLFIALNHPELSQFM